MELFKIENLSFKYPGENDFALNNINLTINKGEFVLISGKSGGGKTTFLRLLKKEISPHGQKSGAIYFNGKNLDALSLEESANSIGFVFQNAEDQIVMDSVRGELCFGLENLGVKKEIIMHRIAEVCGFLGLKFDLDKKPSELSGGEKQLLNLASVMALNPEVLILDEPTAELDPINAAAFLSSLKKLNEESGITVIISEHRLEETFSIADKVVFIKEGGIALNTSPKNISVLEFSEMGKDVFSTLPVSVRFFADTKGRGDVPLNVKEGKKYLINNFSNCKKTVLEQEPKNELQSEKIIELKSASFRFKRHLKDVFCELDLTVYKNEILSIFGGNGAGKTTLLKVLAGVNRLYAGKYILMGKNIKDYCESDYCGRIALLPQNPSYLFVKNTVYEDLIDYLKLLNLKKTCVDIDAVLKDLGVESLKNRHPLDLSVGERQLAAMAKILLLDPDIILFDEPTKGLDKIAKTKIGETFLRLRSDGKTIVLVTHDVDFSAEYSDRCGYLFDGKIASIANAKDFFTQNTYYTTTAYRISRNFYNNAITYCDLINLARLNGLK